MFRSHPLYNQHENVLQLLAYFDEIEVCNPLGGHAGIHKLGMLNWYIHYTCNVYIGMLYYTLGNLRPELRSTHRAIQLAICVPCPLIDKHGFQPILKPFIDDANVLSRVNNSYYL